MSKTNPLDRMKERIKSGPTPPPHLEIMQPTNVDVNVNVNRDKVGNGTPTIAFEDRKNRKLKFEELHTRAAFWLDNDLRATLEKVADGEKGVKTRIINEALRSYFENNGIELIKVNNTSK